MWILPRSLQLRVLVSSRYWSIFNREVPGIPVGILLIMSDWVTDMCVCWLVSGALYLWGQQKNTGDAAMYPKPIHDLSGWNIRSIGCWYSALCSFLLNYN